jgi:peptide deformylase
MTEQTETDAVQPEYTPKELPIVKYPSSILKEVCEPVTEFDTELREFIMDMFYTMLLNKGLGLAAPQVGVLKRVIVMHVDKPVVIVNPVILQFSEETSKTNEGCLSTPNVFADVKRPTVVKVGGQNELGDPVAYTIDGLQAVVIQHEIDHLDGKIFVDRLGKVSKMLTEQRLKKEMKHY